jgi:hypothetical protein
VEGEGKLMDITGILQQLRAQRDAVDVSILALERIIAGGAPKRGRPPKWLAGAREAEAAPKRRGRPSANARTGDKKS